MSKKKRTGDRTPQLSPSQLQSPDTMSAEELAAHIQVGLRKLKAEGGGSSQSAQRALVLDEPPSMDDGEITDKGYINQRAVLNRRADKVQLLHSKPRPEAVIVCG